MIEYPKNATPAEQCKFVATTLLELLAEFSNANPRRPRSFADFPYDFDMNVDFQTGRVRVELTVPASMLVLSTRPAQ